ncbi:MAG: SGNH/GDSL hydrolase family protein [Actinomadura sp.]
MSRRSSGRALATVTTVLAATALQPLAARAEHRPAHGRRAPIRYVALGDSFSSGPLVSLPQRGAPLGCLRSNNNYPSLVSRALRVASFTDVSCDGARTDHMTKAQTGLLGGRSNPPQFSALTRDTTLVSLTIGGNDIGFSHSFRCAVYAFTAPRGAPCMKAFTKNGIDRYRVAIRAAAPNVRAVLRGIRERSPHADVYLLNYLRLLPATGTGCFPVVPVAHGDVRYLRGVQEDLNRMLAVQASAAGVTYVDVSAPGHDMCQRIDRRWVEGIPARPAAPVHPNAAGMRAMAHYLLAAIRTRSDAARVQAASHRVSRRASRGVPRRVSPRMSRGVRGRTARQDAGRWQVSSAQAGSRLSVRVRGSSG